ncbi:hypothetical protein NLI96_g9430 [Meripilus lineatus]|uniref:F-box domain-containing protein n=1 Tax=Meripilus lineatus TaxID=2056292 RepID=A0AAD5V0P0_9APHY|nr:hypothetical protein NLI96_g9430 [Physisporinus lineatus]
MAETDHSSWRLPLEICEKVVQFVEDIDDSDPFGERTRWSLYSCALVCRDWVPISRICLFRRVELADDRTAISFMDTVVASPGLGVYVQDLTIDLDQKQKGWIYQLLQVLPPRLPNLDHLEYRKLPVLHPLFFGLSPRFTTVSSVRLSLLERWSFREIVRLVSGFKNLKKLEVLSGRWVPSESFYVPRKSTPLKMFRIDCGLLDKDTTDLVRWLTKKQSIFPLDGLHLTCHKMSVQSQHFSELLLQCSLSLKRLKLMWDQITYNDHLVLDRTCKRLVNL